MWVCAHVQGCGCVRGGYTCVRVTIVIIIFIFIGFSAAISVLCVRILLAQNTQPFV